jgi:H+-translocating NAD(P) transhydrogenase
MLIHRTGSISGLASQETARRGNILGILGVASGIIASLFAVGFSYETLVQFGVIAGVGSVVGKFPVRTTMYSRLQLILYVGAIIGRRITPTGLPQTVAALHSVVGLAAVLTSIGSVLADVSHISTLHLVTAYLGVLIGMRCLPI